MTAQWQAAILANKVAKGFNTTDVPFEICLLQGEVAEFFDAWRRQDGYASELADIAIYCFGLAAIVGVDLTAEIEVKIRENAARTYSMRDGVPTRAVRRIGDADPSDFTITEPSR